LIENATPKQQAGLTSLLEIEQADVRLVTKSALFIIVHLALV
jgi:hypothetical protein